MVLVVKALGLKVNFWSRVIYGIWCSPMAVLAKKRLLGMQMAAVMASSGLVCSNLFSFGLACENLLGIGFDRS